MPVSVSAPPSIDDVPTSRILCAIRSVAATSTPLPADALIRNVRRKLGFDRTGSHIRATIADQLKLATRRHVIKRSGELVSVDFTSINDYSLAELQAVVMAVVTRQPMDRAEVIVAAARELGFSRTGGLIEERFKSAISGLIRRKRLGGDSAHVWRIARKRE
jgi:hypothetical protein